jgi:hypothetical protein
LEGKVAEFLLRKPHSFLQVEVPDQKGHVEMWLAEWGDGSQLSRTGVFQETLKTGDRVVVTANPARNPTEHKVHIVAIRRPSDGWTWNEVNN